VPRSILGLSVVIPSTGFHFNAVLTPLFYTGLQRVWWKGGVIFNNYTFSIVQYRTCGLVPHEICSCSWHSSVTRTELSLSNWDSRKCYVWSPSNKFLRTLRSNFTCGLARLYSVFNRGRRDQAGEGKCPPHTTHSAGTVKLRALVNR
jgi:hypothetical protein